MINPALNIFSPGSITTSSQQRETEPNSEIGFDPWQIEETDFPARGTSADKLKFLLNYAVLAPSGHNTQPWLFQIVDDAVELYADKTRALPVVDPDNRELIISCGAALFHLRIAIRHFGYGDVVEVLPNQEQPDLLARIRLGSKRKINLEEHFLFRAIPKRRTNRLPFASRQIPNSLISQLQTAICRECAWLDILPKHNRHKAINLIIQGDRIQMANPLFRRELASWINPSNSPNHDGIPLHAQGIDKRLDSIAPLVAFAIRTFNLGKSQSHRDRRLAENAPVLAVLGTDEDTPKDWLKAGQGLARMLLQARIDDVWVSFFNQPIEVAQLRTQLQEILRRKGFPQLLLRMGYGSDPQPTPRRSVNQVLLGN